MYASLPALSCTHLTMHLYHSSCVSFQKKKLFFFLKDFPALEYQLVNVSDPAVLLEFYAPIQDSLSVINNALGTLAQEGDEMIRARQEV